MSTRASVRRLAPVVALCGKSTQTLENTFVGMDAERIFPTFAENGCALEQLIQGRLDVPPFQFHKDHDEPGRSLRKA
ncbi:MAG: hypothetical protein GX443_01260 [Deltaproteobacteria bacterium]|nr:hypothetical protein [Deltaproteobacteria bacterium]